MQLGQLNVTIKGLFLAFGVAGLVSCGGGDDASDGPSCGGVDESGICLQVTLIDPFNLDSEFTSDVDVNLEVCDPGPPVVPEPFTEHFAEVTLSAFFVSGNVVAASFVQVTGMTVTFTQNTTDPLGTCTNPTAASAPCGAVAGPGPAIAQLTTPVNVTIPVGTSVIQTVALMNFQRKDDYTPAFGPLATDKFDIFTDGPFDPLGDVAYLSYNVRYVFTGEDEFGNSVDATGATEVTIGAYNNCT